MEVKIKASSCLPPEKAAGFTDAGLPCMDARQDLGAADGLPLPLEAQEERQLLSAFGGEGDKKAKSKLIEHNLRLVAYIAQKFGDTGIGVGELISIGTIGLIKGVNTFNPEKKIRLATYASHCIENEILMYLRRCSRIRMEVSIEEPLHIDWDGNELLLSDVLGTEEDIVSRDMEKEAEYKVLKAAISKLSSREQTIVQLRYGIDTKDGAEKTQKEVADLLGISQSYISRLEKRIIQRLHREMVRLGL